MGTTTMAISLGTLCSNGVPLASFEKYSCLPPPPPLYNVEVGFWNRSLIFNIVWGGGEGGRDSRKTCKRLQITVEITFSYFSLKYYQVSQGLMAIIVNYGHKSWDTLLKWRPISVIWKILLPRPLPRSNGHNCIMGWQRLKPNNQNCLNLLSVVIYTNIRLSSFKHPSVVALVFLKYPSIYSRKTAYPVRNPIRILHDSLGSS